MGHPHKIYIVPVVIVLISAAVLKGHGVSVAPTESSYILESRLATICLIQFEFLLSLWLLSAYASRAARMVGLLTFATFTIASLKIAITGETNCGCFGTLEVNPRITTILDVAMVYLLLQWNPQHTDSRKFPWVLFVLALATPAFLLNQVQSRKLGYAGVQNTDSGKLLIIDASEWHGLRFPIENEIEDSKSFMRGKWRVVFYHEDCPKCQELIRSSRSYQECKTVFIEMPPYSGALRTDEAHVIWRKLSTQYRWFAEAPMATYLLDGVVTDD